MTWNYCRTVRHLLKQIKSSRGRISGAEIGVYHGGLSSYLLSNIPGLHLVLVDHWELGCPFRKANIVRADFLTAMANVSAFWPRWHAIKAQSTTAAAILEANAARFDFVFIDANHGYESVKEDIAAWWPLVRPGGLFCGHDYHGRFDGVDRAVDEFAASVNLKVTGYKGHVWAIWKGK